jgi:hypothetical protein
MRAARLELFWVFVGQAPGDIGDMAWLVGLLVAGRNPVAAEMLPEEAALGEDADQGTTDTGHRDGFVFLWLITDSYLNWSLTSLDKTNDLSSTFFNLAVLNTEGVTRGSGQSAGVGCRAASRPSGVPACPPLEPARPQQGTANICPGLERL